MKLGTIILLALVLFVPYLAAAQTPVSKETANTYYANCLSAAQTAANGTPQSLSPQSQTMMCACTAARMTTNFTMEDMQTMTGQDPAAARLAYNKMLVNVYAPCMETPTYDYYYGTCMQNPQSTQYGNNKESICRCLGGTMALHLRQNGAQVFNELLQRNPNLTDPMGALTSDPAFETFAMQKLTACLK